MKHKKKRNSLETRLRANHSAPVTIKKKTTTGIARIEVPRLMLVPPRKPTVIDVTKKSGGNNGSVATAPPMQVLPTARSAQSGTPPSKTTAEIAPSKLAAWKDTGSFFPHELCKSLANAHQTFLRRKLNAAKRRQDAGSVEKLVDEIEGARLLATLYGCGIPKVVRTLLQEGPDLRSILAVILKHGIEPPASLVDAVVEENRLAYIRRTTDTGEPIKPTAAVTPHTPFQKLPHGAKGNGVGVHVSTQSALKARGPAHD